MLTGTSIETKGLSIKYPDLRGYKGRQLILLDSAGLETPVLKKNLKEKEKKEVKKENEEKKEPDKEPLENEENNEKDKHKDEDEEKTGDKEIEANKNFKENARDKIMTELFLENFIIRYSDILLIVVGKLTYSEQLLINKIKVESKKQNKGRLFIIHNLQEFREVRQIEDYIKNILLKCSTFDLKKKRWITTKKDAENINKESKDKDNKEIKENNIQNEIKEENEIKDDKDKEERKKENQNNDENQDDGNKNDNNPKAQKDDNLNKNIDGENVKEESKLNDIHFTEILNYGDKKKLEVYHLILANEDSEAGKVYNQYTYNFIEGVYNLISEPKKFEIFKQIEENFKMLSSTIFIDNIEEYKFNDEKEILEKKNYEICNGKTIVIKKMFNR